MHDSNDEAPIYRDLAGDGEEFRRALRHACAGLRPPASLLFDPANGDWECFYTGVFTDRIVSHFSSVYAAAVAGEIGRVVTLDESFAAHFDPSTQTRLAAAATVIFDARAGATALRQLAQLKKRRPNCGFPTAFAAHAASFNIPLLQALIAYLAVEWRAGQESAGLALENSREWEKMFTRQLLASPEPIRQILARSLRGWAEVA